MNIIYDNKNKTFNLQTKNTSYIINITEDNYVSHVYYGKKLKSFNLDNLRPIVERNSFSPNPVKGKPQLSLDTLSLEYPSYGAGDFRVPAYELTLNNGSRISEFKYKSHNIYKGKKSLCYLPSTYIENDDEAMSLEINLTDELINLNVILTYTVFKNYDAVTRSVKFINNSGENIILNRALSMNIDFNNSDFDYLHLHGSWTRERYIERSPLIHGNISIESRRGSSSHNNNPFIALLSKDATEDYGDVYGFNLIYSGNFLAQAEVDQYNTTRVSIGINPFDFSWLLEPSEEFITPEAVMVYSSDGLGEMSRTFHDLYRERLCRGTYRDKERPILVNNWEATYFDFNDKKIEKLAGEAANLGIELLVLDDGWFGHRNDDTSSLGDWFVDSKKLPNGLKDLAEKVNNHNLKFGLWFEPEMISPDSELYKKHPSWCLHAPGRRKTEGRNQLVLDLARKDVCDYIIDSLSGILSSVNIEYVKWDYNRNMTEVYSVSLPAERQKETAHRYMLGLYRIMDTLTKSFPDVLFEGCSGGGGRFDGGILYYMPQIWTSDDTDAVERLKIQYGTSIVYPVCTMGSHVSAVPNHQVQRITSLKTRGDVAMSGNLGYELDLGKFTEEEKKIVKNQIKKYKKIRQLIQFGDLYRLKNPFTENETAWIIVSKDKEEAYLSTFKVLSQPNPAVIRVKLQGLDPYKTYKVTADSGENLDLSGEELVYSGITIQYDQGDFVSKTFILKAYNN